MIWWRRNVRASPDVPQPVVDVFRLIDKAPVIEDANHHYELIRHSIGVLRRTCRRTVIRRGVRVKSGSTYWIDMEMAAGVPYGTDATRNWSAIDRLTGRQLRVEVANAPDAYRKLCRVWLAEPVTKGGRFDIAMDMEVPLVDVDGFGTVGVKFRGYPAGIDTAEIEVTFMPPPDDVKTFVSRSGRIDFAVMNLVRRSSDIGGVATYELALEHPPEQQLLVAWYRNLVQQEPQMRILFLAANPLTANRLDLEEELRSLKREIESTRYRDAIELLTEEAVRPDDLVRHVSSAQPNVIHFSGHGSKQGIVVRTDDGHHLPVEGKNLRRFLKDRRVALVVLNSCYSREQANSIADVVPAVVGTTGAVGDEAARRFSVAFYRHLGNGGTLREAFRNAGDAVALHGLTDVFHSQGDLDQPLIRPEP